MSENGKAKNGAAALNALANLNWPTVALIILTGGTNWFTARQGASQLSQQLTQEQQEALHKIRDVHDSLEVFEAGMRSSLTNQAQILDNQSQMLQDQKSVLKQIRDLQASQGGR